MRAAEALRDERLQRRRPAVHVPVEIARHRRRRCVGPAAPLAHLEAPCLDVDPLAVSQQAALHDLVREDVVPVPTRAESAEGAHLQHPAIAVHRVDERPAFADAARQRLLAQDVLARLGRRDADERVPVRRRGDGDQIDILAIQHAAKIGVDRPVVRPADKAHVALREPPDGEAPTHFLKGPVAAAAAADEGGAERIAGRDEAWAAQDMPRYDQHARGRRRLHKSTPTDLRLTFGFHRALPFFIKVFGSHEPHAFYCGIDLHARSGCVLLCSATHRRQTVAGVCTQTPALPCLSRIWPLAGTYTRSHPLWFAAGVPPRPRPSAFCLTSNHKSDAAVLVRSRTTSASPETWKVRGSCVPPCRAAAVPASARSAGQQRSGPAADGIGHHHFAPRTFGGRISVGDLCTIRPEKTVPFVTLSK